MAADSFCNSLAGDATSLCREQSQEQHTSKSQDGQAGCAIHGAIALRPPLTSMLRSTSRSTHRTTTSSRYMVYTVVVVAILPYFLLAFLLHHFPPVGLRPPLMRRG